jgi:hypothetical protein
LALSAHESPSNQQETCGEGSPTKTDPPPLPIRLHHGNVRQPFRSSSACGTTRPCTHGIVTALQRRRFAFRQSSTQAPLPACTISNTRVIFSGTGYQPGPCRPSPVRNNRYPIGHVA